jgi:hypothetical protein
MRDVGGDAGDDEANGRGDGPQLGRAAAADRAPSCAFGDCLHNAGRPDSDGLGAPAEFVRELIRTRTSEPRARARARGVKMGRSSKMAQHQQKEPLRRRDAGGAYARDRKVV